MSPIVLSFLLSAVLPAALVSGLLLASKKVPQAWRSRFQAVVFAAGLCMGSYLVIGRVNFPPQDFNESVSFIALFLASFAFFAPRSVGSRYLVRAIFVAIVFLIILWNLREAMDSMINKRNALAFYFLALGTWSIVEKGIVTVSATTCVALPLVSATALSLILLFKGSASFSQQVVTCCALFGGLLTLTLIWRKILDLEALGGFLSVLVVAFMAGGHFYLDINPWHMVFLAFPYLILWINNAIPFKPKSALGEALMLSLISAAPLAYFVYDVFKTSGPLY